jgi:hypothetical protein
MKERVGQSDRAVARNGRVLLATNRPLTELDGAYAHVRLQTWHKIFLPGDQPTPYGVLLHVRVFDSEPGEAEYEASLVCPVDPSAALALDVGGGRWLEFRRIGA